MFFTPGHANDQDYIILRDDPRYLKDKDKIEQLWTVHKPYADIHFLPDAKCQFHQRIWEMILTNTFINRGLIPQKTPDAGPEFIIEISGERFWIEAIAPGPGDGGDAVPPPSSIRDSGKLDEQPNDKIVLRLTHAVSEKLKKYEKDRQKGRIRTEDGFILAINGYKALNGWSGLGEETDDELPVIIKAVLPIGSQYVSWKKNTGEMDEGFAYRPEISKEKGSPVSTCWFQMEEGKVISTIIYSEYGLSPLLQSMGSEFIFIHNHRANHPLNHATFKFGRHYWLESDQLKCKTY